jgi:hypothetical protein
VTVSIDVAAGLIFLVSCLVGFAAYRHTHKTSTAVPRTGDLGIAFTVGSVTIVALAFLFGVTGSGDQQATETPSRPFSVPSSPCSGGVGTTPDSPTPGGVASKHHKEESPGS